MIMRRFVNLVAQNYKSGLFSLHRLDVSKHLFYPSAAEADAVVASMKAGAGPAVIPRLKRLPPPLVTLQPSLKTVSDHADLPLFTLVSPRSSEGRIITVNKKGHNVIYNADSHSFELIPSMKGFTGIRPTVISTGPPGAQEEDLFVLHSDFHVLRFGSDNVSWFPYLPKAWRWEPLPQPPFSDNIMSHTVIDRGRTICFSSSPDSFGTYCFDTVEREWWGAGSWVLPFQGGVVYVPDLNIWLGFSPKKPHHLCVTSDLSAMDQLIALGEPPAVQYVLEDLYTPKNWFQLRSNLLNLGGGRFCVAKVFQEATTDIEEDLEEMKITDSMESLGPEFVVFTGIELVTSGSSGVKKLGLRIHKSLRYFFGKYMIRRVL